MRDPYIKRRAAQEALKALPATLDAETVQRCIEAVTNLPGADVVSRDCFDKILSENDVAREQLAQIGKHIRDKMNDVVKVERAALERKRHWSECGNCGAAFPTIPKGPSFCWNCGAKFDKEGGD